MSLEGADTAVANLRKRVEAMREKRAVYLAATGTMAQVADRVWNQGKQTDGSAIGYDEDYDLYAYRPPAPRKVSGKGKPFSEWKDQARAKAIQANQKGNARKIKGGYYKSYLAFKADQGRRDAPYELTGRLRKAYLSSPSRPDSLTEVSDTECFISLRGDEAGKYIGLTEAKGPFLRLNDDERNGYAERLRDIWAEA